MLGRKNGEIGEKGCITWGLLFGTCFDVMQFTCISRLSRYRSRFFFSLKEGPVERFQKKMCHAQRQLFPLSIITGYLLSASALAISSQHQHYLSASSCCPLGAVRSFAWLPGNKRYLHHVTETGKSWHNVTGANRLWCGYGGRHFLLASVWEVLLWRHVGCFRQTPTHLALAALSRPVACTQFNCYTNVWCWAVKAACEVQAGLMWLTKCICRKLSLQRPLGDAV